MYDAIPGYSVTGNAGNKVSVQDPNRPGTEIWVDAQRNSNGDLVPIDPRYDPRTGWDGTRVTQGGSQTNSGLVWLGVGVVALVLLLRSR
jgi:hypothetical protein